MITLKPISAPATAAPKPDPELRKAAEAFEAVMLRQMMASMRKAKLGDDIMGSSATDNFREMADARVADFLLQWAYSLAERGLRTDQINVHMTRADIGNYLGLTLESVSRALSRLARNGVIEFNEKGRRDISIPNLTALSDFIQKATDPSGQVLQ